MKSIFIDCNNQLAPVFARVRRADDPLIAVNSDPFQPADLPRLLADYDICLDDHSYMPTEVMARCRGLKHIVFLGTGASSYMDVPALNRLGIKVHTIKGYGDIAVAEHTMALIFACCRGLARMDRAVRGGVWDPLESMQLNGKTLGLIGLGGIGREVARIARGVGMEVIGWNRSPRSEVRLVELDELLARADIISLHLALNDETRDFIDAERLAPDWTLPTVLNESVAAAWLSVYKAPDARWALYELAEKLVDLETAFRFWRFRHATTVERIIGFKTGTGGTAGVSYLKKMLDVVLFPELFALRTAL